MLQPCQQTLAVNDRNGRSWAVPLTLCPRVSERLILTDPAVDGRIESRSEDRATSHPDDPSADRTDGYPDRITTAYPATVMRSVCSHPERYPRAKR